MKKYITYIQERFPLGSHLPIIAIFSFSAICYSLACVGATAFVPFGHYVAAFALTFGTFFLLRIADEFKDHADDVRFRPYLPVPRGLVTLAELRRVGIGVFIVQCGVLWAYPFMLPTYLLAMGYMVLMYKEFFVAAWLKRHQLVYVFSHIAIIPLVDLMASSAHWADAGLVPPAALGWFFVVSFFNGMVLEFGRKLRAPEREEPGVVSYTQLYGLRGGVGLWLATLTVTLLFAVVAAEAIVSPGWVYVTLGVFYVMALVPGLLFLRSGQARHSKAVELFSGIWTLGMYLNIGALPFVLQHII